MLEWSSRKIKKNKGRISSLADAYDDLLNEHKDTLNYKNYSSANPLSAIEPPAITSIEEMRNYLYALMASLNLKNVELKPHKPTPKTWEELNLCYAEYRKLRATFLKFIGFHDAETCYNLGMSDSDIKILQKGIAPENFCVHLKVPFDFGGKTDINNLCLVKTHPAHDNLHKIIDIQLQNGFIKYNRIAFIPYIEGRIFHG